MSRITSLLWKEWREAQAYLWIGLGLFLVLPAVGEFEAVWATPRRFELSTSPWVMALGGVLAVLAAVGVTAPDLRPKVADFWQSRPIGVGPWLAVKYTVALAAVLAACTLPLVAELATNHRDDATAADVLTVFPFYWAAIFSLAFAAGCVVARPAHAAALGLAAMLLVYVLPVVLPPLAWLGVPDDVDFQVAQLRHPLDLARAWGPGPFVFAGGMLAIAAAAVALSVASVRRGWRVESGRRLLYCLAAAAALLLFASAGFQLGSNLPILQTVDLPPDSQWLRSLTLNADGGGGTVDGYSEERRPGGSNESVRTFRLGPAGIALGPPGRLTAELLAQQVGSNHLAVGRFLYRAGLLDSTEAGGRRTIGLSVIDDRRFGLSATDADLTKIPTIPLWDRRPDRDDEPTLYRWQDKVYVMGARLDVLDVSRPDRPRVVLDAPNPVAEVDRTYNLLEGKSDEVRLIPLPGLPPEQRLAATILARFGQSAFDGRVLCGWFPSLSAYRLTRLTDDSASFEKIGEYEPTKLQQLVEGFQIGRRLTLSNGLLYVDGLGVTGTFNPGVTIVDTRGPHPMRSVGHFAAPGAQMIRPLPDGRAIVGGGNKLWLVGAPRRAGG